MDMADTSEAIMDPSPEEARKMFSGLVQSTPQCTPQNVGRSCLKLLLTSPDSDHAVPRIRASSSGTYLALPPTWTQSRVVADTVSLVYSM